MARVAIRSPPVEHLVGFTVQSFESTPNPNAVKCVIEPSPTERPRSYFNAQQAEEADDPLAHAIFAIRGVSSLLIHQTFITVNKTPDAGWGGIKKAVRQVLADAEQ